MLCIYIILWAAIISTMITLMLWWLHTFITKSSNWNDLESHEWCLYHLCISSSILCHTNTMLLVIVQENYHLCFYLLETKGAVHVSFKMFDVFFTYLFNKIFELFFTYKMTLLENIYYWKQIRIGKCESRTKFRIFICQ